MHPPIKNSLNLSSNGMQKHYNILKTSKLFDFNLFLLYQHNSLNVYSTMKHVYFLYVISLYKKTTTYSVVVLKMEADRTSLYPQLILQLIGIKFKIVYVILIIVSFSQESKLHCKRNLFYVYQF